MTREQFSSYWRTTHADLVRRLPGLKRYVQNHPVAASSANQRIDGVAELWVDSQDDLQALMDSPECREALDSVEKLCDNMTTILVEEQLQAG